LKEIGRWLDHGRKTDLPYVVYGTVAGLSLWPLVEAAVQTSQVASVIGALYTVAAGVGADLIAGQLEAWKDRAQRPAEEEVNRWAREQAADTDLRDRFDAILLRLDSLTQAQQALPPVERNWFAATLRQELAALGNLSRYEATLIGSGAIAQGAGAVALGERAVYVEGDFYGNIYNGAPPDNTAAALHIYRQIVFRANSTLPLRGVDVGVSDPASGQRALALASVYIDLDTTQQLEEHGDDRLGLVTRRPLSALAATIENPWLVLLGDPGSGKSTFVNHLAVCLAAHHLDPTAGWHERLADWPAEEVHLLPLLLIMRDFARELPQPLPRQATPQHLWTHVQGWLTAHNLAFAAEPLHQALEDGQVLVLLDGLDEVPEAGQRAFVRDAVAAFAGRYPDNRYLVTCRVLAYQPPGSGEPDLRLTEETFPVFELALFDEEKVDRFIEAWYAELARIGTVREQDRPASARQLREAVRREDLSRLAPNPLLLTTMALVHTHRGRLPEARALLYEETVDLLLWHWEQVKTGAQQETPALRQLLLDAGRSEVDLKKLLWRLAYDAHAHGGVGDDQLAGISELALMQALAALKRDEAKREDWNWARQVVAVMRLRAGLLIEREPGTFTFPHRTFQEYLAGAHLSLQENFARKAMELAGKGALWREVITLAAGRLVHLVGDVEKPLLLVSRLCPQSAVETEVAWRNAWLAGDIMLEVGAARAEDEEWSRDLPQRTRQRLVSLLEGGWLAPRERAMAAISLARLGDPRHEVMTVDGMQFCYVPAGPFWMGSEKGGEYERLHQVDIPYDYWLGRYPVTNAQFAEFVADKGYEEAGFWPEARAADRWKPGFYRDWGDEWRERPSDYGYPFTIDNHPVVGVSWYEALAFARWLTRRWREKGWLPQDWQISLPSEAEWEKAARGGELVIRKLEIGKAREGLNTREASLIKNDLNRRVYP
jgi:hypothetical protein